MTRATEGGGKRPRKKEGRGRYDRGQTSQERRHEQRERLILAAAEVFAAKGFANASVEAIVKSAGMSRRTFYEHFEDLRDVLLQVHEYASSTCFRFVEEAIAGERDPVERLRKGIEAFFVILVQRGDLSRVLFREIRAAGPIHEARHEAQVNRYVSLIFEGVAEAHARGLASRPPDELTVFALVSAMEAIIMRYLSRREEARAIEAAPKIIELVARAFR